MKQKVAFFDIDGTIFRSSLLIELVEECITQGIFKDSIRTQYEKEHELWLNREGAYDSYINAVIKAFVENIRGVYYGDFADVGTTVVQAQGKQMYRYTRDLVHELREKGYYLVAISQSPKTILDKFCKQLGFDKVYGRIYELDEKECFTGKISHLEKIEHKANIVQHVFNKGGFIKQDSIGVGDTDGDISLLESIEQPICFNPNSTLYAYAKEKNWKVVIERKDVIYTL